MTELHRTEIHIDAAVEHVFKFFVEPERLSKWLGRSARLQPRPGGQFRFEVTEGEWCVGEYLEVVPPRRVSFTWGWENEGLSLPPGSSVVEVELKPENSGTRLTLVHRGLPDADSLALHADGWSRYLPRLDRVARGLDAGPDPARETPEQARDRLDLSSTIEIQRPADDVFAVISDFSRNPEWQGGMRRAHWTSEPPLRVGSTYDQVARFLGRDVITSFEVVAFEPGRSVTIESRESSFPITVTRTVEPTGTDRSRVTATISGQPGRFFFLVAPLLRPLVERSVRRDYRRLKELLEAS